MPHSPPDFALRPEQPEDQDVLRGLYILCRWPEMAAAGLPEEERPEFLTWQYFQQHDHFAVIGAEVWAITVAGEEEGADTVAGRLVVQETPGTLTVLDLALLPPWQGLGLDAAVLALAAQRAQEDGQRLVRADPGRIEERAGLAAPVTGRA